MIAVIRISGQVGLEKGIIDTMDRLRIKRKYACVLMPENKVNRGMLNKVRNYVAYGKVDSEMIQKIFEARGKLIDKTKKTDLKKVAGDFEKGKKMEELNVKPFFRLHPPRKGINSKQQYPKGVLGNHGDKINELIERML